MEGKTLQKTIESIPCSVHTTPDQIRTTESAGRKDLKGAQEQHMVSKTLHWKTTPSMTINHMQCTKTLKTCKCIIISTESKLPE